MTLDQCIVSLLAKLKTGNADALILMDHDVDDYIAESIGRNRGLVSVQDLRRDLLHAFRNAISSMHDELSGKMLEKLAAQVS